MAKETDVFKVLVTKNQAILGSGKAVTDLTVGQLGIFDADTHMSVDATTAEKARQIFIAVGNEGGYNKSAGTSIDVSNIRAYTVRPYTNSENKKVVFKNFKVNCGKDYSIRVETINEFTKFTVGTNNAVKTLTATSANCTECGTTDKCADINPIPVVLQLLANAKVSEFVTVKAIARVKLLKTTHKVAEDIEVGKEVNEADLKALSVFNASQTDPANMLGVDLEFEAVPIKKATYQGYNFGYYYPRETQLGVYPTGAFLGNGVIEVTAKGAIEEGAGYDIREKEYKSTSGDFVSRFSNYYGAQFPIELNTDVNETYTQIVLTYGKKAEVGVFHYDTGAETIIAVPTADSSTVGNSILTILDKFATKLGFDELADDLTTGFVDSNGKKPTNSSTKDKDGVA